MNKKIVILSLIIVISMTSISPINATEDNVIQENNNPLEDLWNKFVQTISYIFTHEPLDYIEESEELIEDNENTTLDEMNMTNSSTHNIHEENTLITEELNSSYVNNSENSVNDSDKTTDLKSG